MESMVNANGLRKLAVPYIGRAGGGVTPEYRFVANVSQPGINRRSARSWPSEAFRFQETNHECT
jgi:hypothetical protein